MNTITEEKIRKYFNITEKALKKAKINEKQREEAEKILNMAKRYFEDAKYFYTKKDLVTAFGALNYAHGWLDAGAHLGYFDVKDDKLFVVKE